VLQPVAQRIMMHVAVQVNCGRMRRVQFMDAPQDTGDGSGALLNKIITAIDE
jgi:hypothetical protein